MEHNYVAKENLDGIKLFDRWLIIILLSILVNALVATDSIGKIRRCSAVIDCEDNETDYLMMVANDLI